MNESAVQIIAGAIVTGAGAGLAHKFVGQFSTAPRAALAGAALGAASAALAVVAGYLLVTVPNTTFTTRPSGRVVGGEE